MYGFETIQFAPDGITTTTTHDLCRHKNSQFTKYLPFLKKVMAAPLRDLALLPERFQKIFWGSKYVPYSEQSTVASSVVVINEVMTPPIPTMSRSGTHAEIDFIEEAKAIPHMGQIQEDNIAITINLSRSPCFRCREDLEDFLESLTRRGATVSFTLRIANLYKGVGSVEGTENDIVEYLASWLSNLHRENIVNTPVIQPISVVTEIPHYRPRPFDDALWLNIQEDRNTRDTAIARIVAKIVTTVDEQRAIAQRPQETRPLFTTLTEVIEDSAELKRTFVESDATSNVCVAVAQVQINAQNNFGRIKGKVFIPIKDSERGCCQTIPRIITAIEERNRKPQSWNIRSKTIVLAVTHFPCNNCIVKITRNLQQTLLILRVANIHYKRIVVDWLFEHYRAGITVQLHAIRVMVELGQVNCRQNPTEVEQRQWRIDMRQRRGLDVDAAENVRWINKELLFKKECVRLNATFECMQIDDTTTK